ATPPEPVPTQEPPGDPVFPTTEWATATPADMNMEAAKREQARDYSLIGGGSGLIVRRGRVVYSWGDTAALYTVKSASKSIGRNALGLAVDGGPLESDA